MEHSRMFYLYNTRGHNTSLLKKSLNDNEKLSQIKKKYIMKNPMQKLHLYTLNTQTNQINKSEYNHYTLDKASAITLSLPLMC